MNKIVRIFIYTLCLYTYMQSATKNTHLQELTEDFKNYHTTNTNFHAGDLYEHSLWVAITINNWFEKNIFWTNNLDAHDRALVTLAGLLHDIGKAGDLDFTYYTKSDHHLYGQEYILGQRTYRLANNKIFDFAKLFNELGISNIDKKLISILVGAHHEFGNLLKYNNTSNLNTSNLLNNFQNNICVYAQKAQYQAPIDTRIMNMAILLAAADVKGALHQQNSAPFTICDYAVQKSPINPHAHTENKFKQFNLSKLGKEYRTHILNPNK